MGRSELRCKDEAGRTPLQLALDKGMTDVVRVMAAVRSVVTPLAVAAEQGEARSCLSVCPSSVALSICLLCLSRWSVEVLEKVAMGV